MRTITSRAARWRLALTVATVVATIAALGACADEEQPATAPVAAHLDRATLGPGTVITVTNTRGTKETGSLRWAVQQATGGEIIRFAPAIAGGTIVLDSTIYITHPITIEADSVRGMTLSGGNARRVIDIYSFDTGIVKLRNLTITGGRLVEGGGGAGVRSNIALVIQHSTFHGNYAGAAPAILALGPLDLDNSTISNNMATGYLYAAVSAATTAWVRNTTIAFNSQGGMQFSELGGGMMANTIIVNNGGFLNNCQNISGVRIGGVNIASDLTCGDSIDVMIGDPNLAPLADNGGPSLTHAVSRQSIAFNSLGTGCENMVDQRYKRRDTYCDVGAFEVDSTKVTITIDPNVKVDAATGRAMLTGTVTCSQDETFQLALELHQTQKAGKQTVDVHAAAPTQATCGKTSRAWSQQMVLTEGGWQNGSAQATAQTYQTPEWVVPASAASAVKISIVRK
jgi:hypothetical protein